MTNREQLLYALKVQRLQEILVLKDDIHLQYKYKNINRATSQASTFQDKIIDAVIEDAVTGTSDPINSSTIKKNVENIIDTNLRNDTKRISYGIPDKAVNAAVSNISNRYQFILGNRIREEIPNLQGKIEDYINSKNVGNLSEADLRETLKDQYGEHAQKRIQNIIRDSFHTNECNLSWVKAVYDGYQYKSWNNGRTKRTRVWHKAKFIESVPIDETFDIYGSYPARMMYPGDLNGGAENVANCRCWLSYSNRPPSDLRGTGKKTSTESRKSNKSKNNNGVISKVKNTIKWPLNPVKSKSINSFKSKPKKAKYSNSSKNRLGHKNNTQTQSIKEYLKNKLLKIKYQWNHGGIEDVQIYKDVVIVKQKNCSYATIDEIKLFFDTIPDELKKNVKEIIIRNKVKIVDGYYMLGYVPKDNLQRVVLLKSNGNFQIYKGTILHEFAHVFEANISLEKFAISNSEKWREAYINDILHIIKKGYDLKYEGCVSSYAEEAYFEFFDWEFERSLSEDFAESVELYFSGNKEFMRNYPNRCKLLSEIFGVSSIGI